MLRAARVLLGALLLASPGAALAQGKRADAGARASEVAHLRTQLEAERVRAAVLEDRLARADAGVEPVAALTVQIDALRAQLSAGQAAQEARALKVQQHAYEVSEAIDGLIWAEGQLATGNDAIGWAIDRAAAAFTSTAARWDLEAVRTAIANEDYARARYNLLQAVANARQAP